MTGSRAAVIMDASTGEILFEKNAGSPRPIASLTKLMTGIVFLETDPDLDHDCTITRDDVLGSGHTQLRAGEVVTVRQLLYHSLMSSDNAATKAYKDATQLGPWGDHANDVSQLDELVPGGLANDPGDSSIDRTSSALIVV